MPGQACSKCGEALRDHRDGICDPILVKRKRRRDAERSKNDMLDSYGVIVGRDMVTGRKYYE